MRQKVTRSVNTQRRQSEAPSWGLSSVRALMRRQDLTGGRHEPRGRARPVEATQATSQPHRTPAHPPTRRPHSCL